MQCHIAVLLQCFCVLSCSHRRMIGIFIYKEKCPQGTTNWHFRPAPWIHHIWEPVDNLRQLIKMWKIDLTINIARQRESFYRDLYWNLKVFSLADGSTLPILQDKCICLKKRSFSCRQTRGCLPTSVSKRFCMWACANRLINLHDGSCFMKHCYQVKISSLLCFLHWQCSHEQYYSGCLEFVRLNFYLEERNAWLLFFAPT